MIKNVKYIPVNGYITITSFSHFRMVAGISGLLLQAAGLDVCVQEKSIKFHRDYKSNTNVAETIKTVNIRKASLLFTQENPFEMLQETWLDLMRSIGPD